MNTDRVVDLVEEGYDVAVRITSQLRANLISQRLATSRLVACAAPSYLKARGEPQTAESLAQHNFLVCTDSSPTVEQWQFYQDGRKSVVRAQGTLRASSNELRRLAAVRGQGIVLQPTFSVGEWLRGGRLVPVLTHYDAGALGIYIIYPNRKYLTSKVRSFIETLTERWGSDPDADPFADPGDVEVNSRQHRRFGRFAVELQDEDLFFIDRLGSLVGVSSEWTGRRSTA